jgi:quercetin dioxygenase-like cupin family protein
MTSLILRDQVNDIEKQMLSMPQVELPVEHYFSHKVYARELHIPKGTTLTGRIHKFANLNILIQGDMSVLIDGEVKRVTAPYTIVSPPGTKRIAYAHEDCIWTTILGTDETDADVIEELFTAQSDQDYLAFCDKLKIKGG